MTKLQYNKTVTKKNVFVTISNALKFFTKFCISNTLIVILQCINYGTYQNRNIYRRTKQVGGYA